MFGAQWVAQLCVRRWRFNTRCDLDVIGVAASVQISEVVDCADATFVGGDVGCDKGLIDRRSGHVCNVGYRKSGVALGRRVAFVTERAVLFPVEWPHLHYLFPVTEEAV